MSRQTIELAYEGEAVAEKVMDVSLLAPALLGMGELCGAANKTLGCSKEVRVAVHSDFQNKCFLIGLDVATATGIWGHIKDVLQNEDVEAAAEMLGWLGFIGTPITYPLLKYLKYKKGKEVEEVSQIADQPEMVKVTFHGDHNSVTIHQNVYQLSESPQVLSALNKVTKPLLEDGFTDLQFRHDNKVTTKLDKSDATHIRHLAKRAQEDITSVTATIVVSSSSFDLSVKKWKFRLFESIVSVDISDTDIAHETLLRGGVNVGDAYRVVLEISERQGKNGPLFDYRVVEVLEYIPGHQQSDWISD